MWRVLVRLRVSACRNEQIQLHVVRLQSLYKDLYCLFLLELPLTFLSRNGTMEGPTHPSTTAIMICIRPLQLLHVPNFNCNVTRLRWMTSFFGFLHRSQTTEKSHYDKSKINMSPHTGGPYKRQLSAKQNPNVRLSSLVCSHVCFPQASMVVCNIDLHACSSIINHFQQFFQRHHCQ